jgi:hypothetical protein
MAPENRSVLEAEEKVRINFVNLQRNTFLDELEILAPHVCIFFTGPYYDEIINSTFSGIEYEPVKGIPERELAALHHPKLPSTFRTYHPNYLWRSRKKRYIDVIRSSAGC